MTTLLDRFLSYARIDTQSDETSTTSPSTRKQLELCRLLRSECEQLGLDDVAMNEFGIVTATVPGTVAHRSPTIGWVAHVDTSPEFSGTGVNPIVHANYQGGDIVLPRDPSRVIRVDENPDLKSLIGGTIITTDGTTLLGADDKSGIAVTMTAAEHLISHPEILHGPIQLCFTCDEEIGRGVDKVDIDALGCVCADTLDSEGMGRIDSETFSADRATVTVVGVNTHPSVGKNAMVNALRILAGFIDRLPKETLSPETTGGREGFLHPYHVEGGVAEARARIILRDFETAKLNDHAERLERIAGELRAANPKARIDVKIDKQYRNMREGLAREPRALAKGIEAVEAAGLKPRLSVIRGGTDGSVLTERGLPTPNLSSGQHNPHSPLEWTSVDEMQKAVDILVQLAILWGRERE